MSNAIHIGGRQNPLPTSYTQKRLPIEGGNAAGLVLCRIGAPLNVSYAAEPFLVPAAHNTTLYNKKGWYSYD